MSNINDKATVSLFVNGEQAEAAMKRLRNDAQNLQTQLQAAMAAGDKKETGRLEKALDRVNRELNRTESAAKGTGIVLDNLSNTSIHGLRNSLKHLEKELRATKPDTERWHSLAEKIKEVKGRIHELNGALKESKSLWQRFKEWSDSAWPAIDLLNQWGSGLFDVMRGAVDAYATMDQEMANVRKFTGMTADQVAELNDEFKKMDTRTSREGLNQLAQEAGRLGKTSKEDVMGFVRAADQINVALDDLGEGATLTLSKLTGVFGDEQRYGTEKSLLKVGSVINELSQNCSASAPYLAQFASRMGGVGAQARMTIPQIMAFGAVLDSNGQQVEASSTALSQVIVRMMQEPAKYAKVAGLDMKKFTEMLKTDVNGALILFLETLQQAGGMDVLSPMFKDMGENGSRAIAALSTLATHIDQVKAQQEVANEAFKEGTSVTNEFNVQNTTVQASIEKAKKAINDLRVELGERLSPLMSHLISSSSAVLRVLVTFARFIMDNKAALITLAAAIAAYNIAASAAAIKTAVLTAATKLLNMALATERLVIIAASGVISLLSGNITRATAAFKLFSLAIKANPIGLAISLITAGVVAIGNWIKKTNDAKEAERQLAEQRAQQAREFSQSISDISESAGNYAKTELDRLKKLYNATQDQTKSQKERIAAVIELQKTYPTAFGNLSQEKILAGEAASAYNTLAQNIIKAARAKAAAEKIKENEKLLLDLEMEREDLEQSINEDSAALDVAVSRRKTLAKRTSRRNSLSLTGPSGKERQALEAAGAAVDDLNKRLDDSSERLETNMMKMSEILKTNERLSKKAVDSSKIAPDVDFSASTQTMPSGKGYTSQVQAEKDAKKAAAEKRKAEAEARRKAAEDKRAEAKSKKEFRDKLNSFKAQRSAADREALEQYKAGTIDYEKLLALRYANEDKYYEASLAHFEKEFESQKDTYLQDDKDYQKLLLDKEKASERYEKTRIDFAIDRINRQKAAEEESAQHVFDVKSDPSVLDEIALQAELYKIRKKALDEKIALYSVGSKEYAEVQQEIESLERTNEMSKLKTYFKAVNALREEYDKKAVAEKYALEKSVLDALLAAEKINAAEYVKYLKGLSEKYKKDLPGSSESAEKEQDKNKYDEDTKALKSALANQLLSQKEFNERMASLDKERRDKMLAGLRESGGEWNAMLVDVYTSFSTLLTGLDGSTASVLGNIANCAAAVSSVIGAGMQIATEFAKAESEIQIAAIEKRYDREIQLAQGNSYKVAKAEKKKEAETAKIKNEASKKQYEMQVVQAIAQSLVAGLNAYSSTMAIPIIGPALAPAAMAVALAMGAAQVALLKKQQKAAEAKGYSEGGFTKPGAVNEPAGIVHAGEWVASQKLLSNPVARPMIEALDYAQRTNTIGSLRPEDVSRSITANNSLVRIAESNDSSALMVAAAVKMSQTVDSLTDRLNEPFVTVNTVTGDHGIKRAQDEYSRLLNNKSPKKRRNAVNN